MLRTVTATRYVTPLREGGSVPALVEADDDGLYVVKLLGAGHGRKALVAELLAGEIGAAPRAARARTSCSWSSTARSPRRSRTARSSDLLERSAGTNFGLDFLPGALAFAPRSGPRPDPELAADSRLARRVHDQRGPHAAQPQPARLAPAPAPDRPRLGAVHPPHLDQDPDEHARRPFVQIRDHVLLPFAASIEAADERLAPRLDRVRARGRSPRRSPTTGCRPEDGLPDADAHRRAYVDYLAVAPATRARAFVEEAERARVA